MTDFGAMPAFNYDFEARQSAPAHDGDTVALEVRLGAGVIREINGRLFGLNAPELGTKANPNPAGITARDAAQAWLTEAATKYAASSWALVLLSKGYDKYANRLDVVIWRKSDGACLNAYMLDNGLAVPYLP